MTRLIEGLDRKDMKWSKFKSSYMYNNVYYKRRTKFIVYQLATTSIGIGHIFGDLAMKGQFKLPAKLTTRMANYKADYIHQQKDSWPEFPRASINNTTFIATFAFNLASCSLIAIILTLALLFDLFWPERRETSGVQTTWKLSALFASVCQLAASLVTTIVVASQQASVTGIPPESLAAFKDTIQTPLKYSQDTKAVIAITLCWVGCAFAFYR